MRIGGVNLARVPLLPVLAAVIAGEVFALNFTEYAFMGAALCVALCVSGLLLRRYVAALMLGFVCVGSMVMWMAVKPEMSGDKSEGCFAGRVIETVARSDSQRLVAELENDNDAGGRVLVYYRSSVPPVEPGDIVAVKGVREYGWRKPAVEGEFSMVGFCRRRGIDGWMEVDEGSLRVVEQASGFMFWMRCLRRELSDAIYASGVSVSTAAMLDALLTGDDTDLAPDVRDDFSHAGIAHVLALSGTHVAIIAFMVSALFFPLRLAGKRKWALGGVVVCLWFYVLLTGGSASVVRTVIMTSVVAVGTMIERAHSPFNSLCCAALLILMFDPLALMSPGFQLSFCAVAGILMFAPKLTFGRGVVRTASQWFAVSVGAVVATAPLAAWHFHVFPIYFLLANVVVALVVPVFMIGGVVLLLAGGLGLNLAWLCGIIDGICGFMTGVSAWVADAPGAYADGIYFAWWALPAWYVAVVAGWIALRGKRFVQWCACALLLVFAFVITRLAAPWFPDEEVAELESRFSTVVLARAGSRCVIYTDASLRLHEGLKEQMEWRLHDYMAMRGIDSLEVREMPEPFGEIWGGIISGAENGVVPHHKINVNVDSGRE